MSIACLFVGYNDWAQCAHMVSRSLRDGGIWSQVVVHHPHALGYDYPYCIEDPMFFKRRKNYEHVVQEFIEHPAKAKWLISTDGEHASTNSIRARIDRECCKYRVGVLHIGSKFRSNPRRCSSDDEMFDTRLRFISPDSMHLVSTMDEFSYPYLHRTPLELDPFTPTSDRKPVVVHSPSSRRTKNTENIMSVFNSIPKDLAEIKLVEGVSHKECVQQRNGGSIFVDQMTTLGGFGYSSVEAAAQGMVPISSLTRPCGGEFSEWGKYGIEKPPVLNASTPEDLRALLLSLLQDRDLLEKRRLAAYTWAKEGSISPSQCSKYYCDIIEQHSKT